MKTAIRITALTALVVLTPALATADWYVFPFAAANTGGDTTRDSGAFGGSFGWMGSWYGGEAEATWSPSFFDDGAGFRTEHKATTYTATALAGPRLGIWQPYGAAGIGLLRSEIEEVGGLARVSDDRPAFHAGGGLMWFPHDRIAVRGDARYIRALDDTEPEGNVFAERFADFSYWRIAGGIAIRW